MRVIDLFSGVGGLSLGAARAGFTVAGSVELDPFAIASHAKNFPNTAHLHADISALSGHDIVAQLGLANQRIMGIIGGPPCQGFSTIGKQAAGDVRNDLFVHFFSIVADIQPAFFLAENVPGIMGEQFDPVRETAYEKVSNYRLIGPIKVKASDYGAPTTRTRMFFIGLRQDLNIALDETSFAPSQDIAPVLVSEALSGLDPIVTPDQPFFDHGKIKVDKYLDTVFHQHLQGLIPPDIGHPETLADFRNSIVNGHIGTRHTPKVAERYGATEGGKIDPVSKSHRLRNNGYCPTLRAGTSKDNGSFQAVRPLHPDQPRVITPREAARLQGFPDWFTFHETKWHSFRQIGNSVCPLVAEHMLLPIFKAIN